MRASRQSLLKIVVAPLLAGLTIAAVTGTAAASTPTLMWTGAKRVNILCNVAGGPGIDHLALSTQLCGQALAIAAKGAPVPVATIALGDPAVLAPDAVTLLIHASVTTHNKDRLLAFSVRPYRTAAEASVLFGAVPRVAQLSSSTANGPALAAALGASLSETLPWLARPSIAQPIHHH